MEIPSIVKEAYLVKVVVVAVVVIRNLINKQWFNMLLLQLLTVVVTGFYRS